MKGMGLMGEVGALLGDVVLETLWPTRCAICDKPGRLICAECESRLPYIDQLKACPRCGSPNGLLECCECNPVSLLGIGLESLPFEACISALLLDAQARRVLLALKDSGERALARDIGRIIANVLPSEWLGCITSCTSVPSSKQNLNARGFDQGELIARELSARTGLPYVKPMARPKSVDQRTLSRKERMGNMRGALKCTHAIEGAVLVVDDVYTTGSTMSAASLALKDAGAREVYGASFARTP